MNGYSSASVRAILALGYQTRHDWAMVIEHIKEVLQGGKYGSIEIDKERSFLVLYDGSCGPETYLFLSYFVFRSDYNHPRLEKSFLLRPFPDLPYEVNVLPEGRVLSSLFEAHSSLQHFYEMNDLEESFPEP